MSRADFAKVEVFFPLSVLFGELDCLAGLQSRLAGTNTVKQQLQTCNGSSPPPPYGVRIPRFTVKARHHALDMPGSEYRMRLLRHPNTHACVYSYIHRQVHIHAHTHIHTHTHTLSNTHIYSHTQRESEGERTLWRTSDALFWFY